MLLIALLGPLIDVLQRAQVVIIVIIRLKEWASRIWSRQTQDLDKVSENRTKVHEDSNRCIGSKQMGPSETIYAKGEFTVVVDLLEKTFIGESHNCAAMFLELLVH